MATKISNNHIETLLTCTRYNTPDVFLAIIEISKEYKVQDSDNNEIRFLIPTETDSERLLRRIIYKRLHFNKIYNISKQTIKNCIIIYTTT